MEKLVKIAAVFITCLCLSSILPGHAEAAKRNAGDVAKLQKIVNSQIKQISEDDTNIKANHLINPACPKM